MSILVTRCIMLALLMAFLAFGAWIGFALMGVAAVAIDMLRWPPGRHFNRHDCVVGDIVMDAVVAADVRLDG